MTKYAVRSLACAFAIAAVGLAGCSGDGGNTVGEAAQDAGNVKWVAGDGQAAQIPASERGDPVALAGTTLDGRPWSVADQGGKVVVVNVWASYCNPCKIEMPALQTMWKDLQARKQPVQFVGVNRDSSVENAQAEVRTYGLTYPSLANDGGRALLPIQSQATVLPTTLVLDRQGRVAARYGGPIETSTLKALIEDAVAEHA